MCILPPLDAVVESAPPGPPPTDQDSDTTSSAREGGGPWTALAECYHQGGYEAPFSDYEDDDDGGETGHSSVPSEVDQSPQDNGGVEMSSEGVGDGGPQSLDSESPLGTTIPTPERAGSPGLTASKSSSR